MDEIKIAEALKRHKKWLRRDEDGIRANLSGDNLSRADLSRANLGRADLSRADLSRANLGGANLGRADLSGANLSGANLSGANLSRANLSVANLRWSDLSDASLRWANLRWAILCKANLIGADLIGANLTGANLTGADLNGVTANGQTCGYWPVCPTEGAFIGWKKCEQNRIVKLGIPACAMRSSATTRKCRCSEARVIWISDGNTDAVSKYDCETVYRLWETVCVPNFDENRWEECSTGIHFFMTREEAEAY